MKKITSIVILLFFIPACLGINIKVHAAVDVLPEGTTRILSYNYDASSGDIRKEDQHLSFQPEQWAEYNVNVLQAGTYNLSMEIGTYAETGYTATATINGTNSYTNYLRGTGGYFNIEKRLLASVVLSEGQNTIRITNESGGYYFDAVVLEKRDWQITELDRVEAERYAYGGFSNVEESSGIVSISSFDWLVYNVVIPSSGMYKMVTYSATATENARGYIAQNGLSVGQVSFINTGSLSRYSESTGFVQLSSGQHEFKIFVTNGKVNFDWFSLAPVNVSSSESFLADLNNAKSEHEIEAVLTTYSQLTGIDVSSETDKIFFKKPALMRLKDKNFQRVGDVINAFRESIDYEMAIPEAALYKGQKPAYSLTSGDHIVFIQTSKLPSPTTVVAAIYKNNALYRINHQIYNTQPYISMNFNGLEIDETDDIEFKLIHLGSLEDITPYNIYGGVYKNIYLAPDGDDNGTGDASNPFKTISRAKREIAAINDSMYGDIVVNILPGYYKLDDTEAFNESHSGKNGYNVIFQGVDPQSPPIIGGGVKVSDWQPHEGGIWKAPLSGVSGIRNLYINGYPATRARSSDKYKVQSLYNAPESEYNDDGIIVSAATFPALSKPQDAELVWNIYWCNHRTPVDDITTIESSAIITLAQPCFDRRHVTASTTVGVGKSFYLENAIELLDEPGEFYYDESAGEIYYMPYAQEDLTIAQTYVADTEFLFDINGASNIIFDNLDIRYGAWKAVNEEGFISVQADSLIDTKTEGQRYALPAQFTVNNASNIQITNSSFSCLGSAAIRMANSVSDSRIEGNVIRDISGSGIVIGIWEHEQPNMLIFACKNIDIKNNVIRRIGYEYQCSTAVSIYYETSITLENNYIAQLPYTGVSVGWGWGSTDTKTCADINIKRNRIDDVMISMGDGAHIYTLGMLRDCTVAYNYLSTSGDSKYGGVYTDSGSAHLNVHNNVIRNCERWFFTGLYHTRNMRAYSNYSDTANYAPRGENNIYIDTTVVTDGNWPLTAQYIMNNAGLQPQYKSMLADSELPTWRDCIIKTTPIVIR
jgi:hypothetical protein